MNTLLFLAAAGGRPRLRRRPHRPVGPGLRPRVREARRRAGRAAGPARRARRADRRDRARQRRRSSAGPTCRLWRRARRLTVMAELGAVLLLFHVGLESTPKEMLAVGGPGRPRGRRRRRHAHAARIRCRRARCGPTSRGCSTPSWARCSPPRASGITARVLKDADALRSGFARIILGAAVIDDVLGLLVLAVVSGIITAAATGEARLAGRHDADRGQGVRLPGRSAVGRLADVAAPVPRRAGAAEPRRRPGPLARASASSCPTWRCGRASRRSSAPSRRAWSWRTSTSRATCSGASRPCTRAWSR